MLPSLTSVSAPQYCRAKHKLSIALERDHLHVLKTQQKGGQWQIEWGENIGLDEACFQSENHHGAIFKCVEKIKHYVERCKEHYLDIQIILPDPIVHCMVFELDALPKRLREQQELVEWRFKKELYLNSENLECQAQALGQDQNVFLLLGSAIDDQFLKPLRHYLHDQGIFPSLIQSGAQATFNALKKHNNVVQDSGILITVEGQYWSTIFWDEHGRPRFFRADWRRPSVQETSTQTVEDECTHILQEVERSAHAYSEKASHRKLSKVYVAGSDPMTTHLHALMAQRVGDMPPCLDFSAEYGEHALSTLASACFAVGGKCED